MASAPLRRLALLLLLCIGAWSGAAAQFDSGAVLGNIKDPTGATIPTATVQLLNVAKGVTLTHKTDATGGYEFDNIQPGEYKMTVTAPGFEVSNTDAFTVNVGARQRVDLALKLGAASDSVTVSGAASELETDTSDRGETVQGVEAVALPLNGRSYADLSQLVPAFADPRSIRSSPTRHATPPIT